MSVHKAANGLSSWNFVFAHNCFKFDQNRGFKRNFLIIPIHKSNPTSNHSTEQSQGVWTLLPHEIFCLECWDIISFHIDVINYAPSQPFPFLNGLFSLEFLYLTKERLLNTLQGDKYACRCSLQNNLSMLYLQNSRKGGTIWESNLLHGWWKKNMERES